MELSILQKFTEKERMSIIIKFQNSFKTVIEKEVCLRNLSNADINFLIYCMDNIHGKNYYSKFLKEE